MKRTQVSTNAGWASMAAGFLNVFGNIQVINFLDTVKAMTFAQLLGALGPFAVGIWMIWHDEKKKEKELKIIHKIKNN